MLSPGCSHPPEPELNGPQLVRHCCQTLDEDGEPKDDFAHSLFMVGEWLMENQELMAQFIALYEEEFEAYGVRVCHAVGFWIRSFPMHFDADPQLCRLVERLRHAATQDGLPDTVLGELDVSSVPSYAWLRNVSVRHPLSRHISLSFEQWSPEDISTSMSYIDYKVLSRVLIPDIKKYVKANKLSHSPVLERSIAVFNSISGWVQCMILSKNTARERAAIIEKFINVGKHLKKLNNFNTLMAVIGGVTHSNISRLHKTQGCVSVEARKELTLLTTLLSNSNNFSNYRKALGERDGRFRNPIMGIHLKDLIAWFGTVPDFDKCRTVTEGRLHQLSQLLSFFLGANRLAHNFPEPNMDLINTLKVSFDISYTDEDIYDLSVQKEPRTLLNFQPARPVVFADWASGVCQAPDPETVNKHVTAMVEAVFKHYDNDRDAYISEAEFRQIAGNFPFIDPFSAIDEDKDGRISKAELKSYFLQLNKQSVQFRRGFKHNFHETTFLTPTFCVHCGKVLWGLIRQGFKCKDCAITAHHACKDVLVSECRPRQRAPSTLTGWLSSPRPAPNGLPDSPGGRGSIKKGLFNNRSKNRAVSAASESAVTESARPASSRPADAAEAGALRASFHRLTRAPVKGRAASETVDCYRRVCSPDASTDTECGLASLASEEVFEDEPGAEVGLPSTESGPATVR